MRRRFFNDYFSAKSRFLNMRLVRVCPCACLPQKFVKMGRKSRQSIEEHVSHAVAVPCTAPSARARWRRARWQSPPRRPLDDLYLFGSLRLDGARRERLPPSAPSLAQLLPPACARFSCCAGACVRRGGFSPPLPHIEPISPYQRVDGV